MSKYKEPFLEPIVRRFRFAKALAIIKSGSVVVDIGCGHTPNLLNRLASQIKEGVGIDPLIGSQKYSNIKLISKMLGEKVPLKNNYADYVTLLAVLEHVEHPIPILKESFRLLKPGGKVLLTTPTPWNKPVLEFLSFRLGLISTREIAEHKAYFWKEDLVAFAKKAGFKKITHEYFELGLNNFLIAEK